MKCAWHLILPLIALISICSFDISSGDIIQITENPGSCPTIPSNINETLSEACISDWYECSNDTDCDEPNTQCCWNGVTHSCMDPFADYYCTSDDDCYDYGMCDPCTLQCMCMMCSALYDPVCASDGKTYPNECAMKSEECMERIPLEVVHEGECGKMPVHTLKVIVIVVVAVVIVILVTAIVLTIVFCKKCKQQRRANCHRTNQIKNKQPLPVSIAILPSSEPEKVALTL